MATLRLGDLAPDFEQDSTQGRLAFHAWAGDAWVVLFSHPADFTPVCTTELGRTAALAAEFARRNVKPIAISVDPLESHLQWVRDIEAVQGVPVGFPILADADRRVATLYDMVHPEALANATVRSVFIIDPARRIRATFTYPASTGRNFDEVLRVIDALQLTDAHPVATPADWRPGRDVVILPSLRDPVEIARRFPAGFRALTPYLRLTPPPAA
jgi:alkyl hydroperoxide reductase subunit AhpC